MSTKTEKNTKAAKAETASEATQAAEAKTLSAEEQLAQLVAQNQQLMSALLGAKGELEQARREKDAEETRYPVKNLGFAAIGFTLFEANGQQKDFFLPHAGATVHLTAAQVEELRAKCPGFLEQGYLSIPDLVEASANVIEDYARFLEEIPYHQVAERIGQFTATQPLYALFNHIENHRFIAKDAHGQPLTDDEGMPCLKVREIDPKWMLVQAAVQQRLLALGGNAVSPDAA